MAVYHTVLVAFVVEGDTMADAQAALMPMLPRPQDLAPTLDSWWVAEDVRYDGSDNDSAVFVPRDHQGQGNRLVARLYDRQ